MVTSEVLSIIEATCMLAIRARRIILHLDMNFMNINENHSGQKLEME
jgi:hypothetical protein